MAGVAAISAPKSALEFAASGIRARLLSPETRFAATLVYALRFRFSQFAISLQPLATQSRVARRVLCRGPVASFAARAAARRVGAGTFKS